MGQPPVVDGTDPEEAEASNRALPFFHAAQASGTDEDAFVVVVRTPLEFCHWLKHAPPAVQWLQVEGLLGEPEIWATAARKEGDVALDVMVADPAANFRSFTVWSMSVRSGTCASPSRSFPDF